MIEKLRLSVYREDRKGPTWQLAQYVHQVLTGISQVVFHENPILGLAVLGAITVASPSSGLAVLAGSVLAQFWANYLKLDQGLTRGGVYAFNSVLLVAAMNLFVSPLAAKIVFSLIGSWATVVLFDKAVKKLSFPVISLPFVLATNACLLVSREIPLVNTAVISAPTVVSPLYGDFTSFITALFTAVPFTFSNLFFMNDFWVGLSVLAFCGVVGDRKTTISAAAGAAIGFTIGSMFGFGNACGFNAALASMGLYPYFNAPIWAALVGAGIASVAHLVVATIFAYFGLPSLSTAFCGTAIGILYFLKKPPK